MGSFTSDGVHPVTISLPAEYYEADILDVPPGGGAGGQVRQIQPLAPSIRGMGVLIYKAGVVPPFANGFPPPHKDGSVNFAGEFNPSITAAVDGPYWPQGFWHEGLNKFPGAATVGVVTTKVLPAGDYDVWGEFDTGSIGAQVGPALRFPYLFIDGLVTYDGAVPPADPGQIPSVSVIATTPTATKGAGDALTYTFVRQVAGGNYSQPLTVAFSVGGSAPASDYTLSQGSPITFPAGSTTVQVRATPINNGVYDPGVTVVTSVQADGANGANYRPNPAPASGAILCIDQLPVCSFTGAGVTKIDDQTYALSVYVNQAVTVNAHGHDADGNLAGIWVDHNWDTPPDNTTGFVYQPAGGYDTDASGAITFTAPGQTNFSVRAMDSVGMYSLAVHLSVTVVDRPPVVAWTTPGIQAYGNDPHYQTITVNVGQTVPIRTAASDPDGNLGSIFVDFGVTTPPVGANAWNYVATPNGPAATLTTDQNFTATTSGQYWFSSRAEDYAGVFSAPCYLLVQVVNRPPTFAWGQAEIRILAGTTAQLPYTLSDPDGNLGVAHAGGANGYTQQASYPNAGNGSGAFAFPAATAGTYTVTGWATDRENLPSATSPTIRVVVEPVNTAPVATFTSPPPGGTSYTVTHFVDDVLPVAAAATDVDGNLASLQIALGGQAWAQAPAAVNVASLTAAGNFTVPPLGAEKSHTWTFTATATDSGTVPGGKIAQAPKSSAAAALNVVVPNRPPLLAWTVPASPAGLTQEAPFVGYLLQPLRITAHGLDRDGNLAGVSILQVGNGNAVLARVTSTDGRTADASFAFTPTTPGLYIFAAIAGDQAGASALPVNLFVKVEDYPSESTGTIGALVVSPASDLNDVFAKGSLPIIVKGGVAALGRGNDGVKASALPSMGASHIIPVPGYLNGTMIPPLSPPILDLRIESVKTSVDHEQPAEPKQ